MGGFYSFRLMFYAFHGKERFADPNDPDVKACDAERAAQLKAEQEAAKVAAAAKAALDAAKGPQDGHSHGAAEHADHA